MELDRLIKNRIEFLAIIINANSVHQMDLTDIWIEDLTNLVKEAIRGMK